MAAAIVTSPAPVPVSAGFSSRWIIGRGVDLTLVIGSAKDRLLPMISSRYIARMAPNLASFVELSGGHCAIVERPDEVNKHLRLLIESVTEDQRASS